MRVVWKKDSFLFPLFLTVKSDLYHPTSIPTPIGARWFRVSGLSTVIPICILAAVLNVNNEYSSVVVKRLKVSTLLIL